MNEASAMKVGIIGAGIMGEALIVALIKYGVKPSQIMVSEKRSERGDELVSKYGITVGAIATNVGGCGVLLLVVKPQDMSGVLAEVKPFLNESTLIVTFAAGKKIAFIHESLGRNNPIIRVMPNTPTLVGAGMAALSIGEGVSPRARNFVAGFLLATGKVVEVPEELQDAVTATSGSGPAYFFAFVESMVSGAQELGLSYEVATQLTIQTIVGAAKLLDESGKSPTTLRENVTSPNGTTAAALASFTQSKLTEVVASAMRAARDRSEELS